MRHALSLQAASSQTTAMLSFSAKDNGVCIFDYFCQWLCVPVRVCVCVRGQAKVQPTNKLTYTADPA